MIHALLGVSRRSEGEDLRRRLLPAFLSFQRRHFSVDHLTLQRITWDCPTSLLEYIKHHSEAVHPIQSMQALKDRLGTNRRVFGLFHPSMPSAPLVFIEVALTTEISSDIKPLISALHDEEALHNPKCAIFYAINSTKPGLTGLSLGAHLIKQAVAVLQKEFPSIDTFSTFSPIPGLRSRFESLATSPQNDAHGLLSFEQDEAKHINDALAVFGEKDESTALALKKLLVHTTTIWEDNSHIALILKRLAARYLALDKSQNRAVDGVANFHIGNGAQLHRICYPADSSSKRMAESYGLMVNYLYELDKLSENQKIYKTEGRIATGTQVQELLSKK